MANFKPGAIHFDRGREPVMAVNSRSNQAERFCSILYEMPQDRGKALREPSFFADLNCDQMIAAIIAGKTEYNLAPFFYDLLTRVEAIRYRHEVMKELENSAFYDCVIQFSGKMREVREQYQLATKMRINEQKQAWQAEAAATYCKAVRSFADDLNSANLSSRGFVLFRDYLTDYIRSDFFTALEFETQKVSKDLDCVKYSVLTTGSGFTVRRYQGEVDYSSQVEETFAKFKQGAAKDYRVKFRESADMNHIEAKILEFVVKLFSDVFGALADYCNRYVDFVDTAIATFDREIQFYLAYLEYIAVLAPQSLKFCYPRLSARTTDISASECFDLVLAQKLNAQGAAIVCNDFSLNGRERVIVVSGPNQGGKTTFSRAFGQIHYLASIGCPVPARDAQLQLFDRLFAHFEKEEKVENLRGKLEDDLARIHAILTKVTSRSVIVLNEIFNSTTIQDETFLSNKIMGKIVQLGALCVWITFADELTSFGPEVVSMVSTVVPENPAVRTFKVVRLPANGLAYAMAIAKKYGLTYESVCERIKS